MAKKILIVDDDPDIVDSLHALLEALGYVTKTTIEGKKSFQLVEEYKPDLILLDYLLSGNDGSRICAMLKDNAETKDIPIIMISAHPNARIQAMQTGANDFLAKPFEVTDLEATIERNLHAV